MFRIRNFGNDRRCRTVAELHQTLKTDYRGRSVSVVWRSPATGIDQVFMLDVCQQGRITSSYGEVLPSVLAPAPAITNNHRR